MVGWTVDGKMSGGDRKKTEQMVFQSRNQPEHYMQCLKHGLRTPNEGINQRYLKNWADVAHKIYFRPYLKI